MVWAARQKLGQDVEDRGFSIKTEAMAELGRVMEKLPKAEGTRGQLKGQTEKRPGGSRKILPGNTAPPTLNELGIDKKTANAARKLAALQQTELNAIIAREKTFAKLIREKKKTAADTALAEQVAASKAKEADPEWCDLHVSHQADLLSPLNGLDAIITDPPYTKAALSLYSELAALAVKALKPGGILAVMCGQSYIPDILEAMTPHIGYRWMMAYVLPGGQSAQLWQRKVNTFWKPVLLFGGSGEWNLVHACLRGTAARRCDARG